MHDPINLDIEARLQRLERLTDVRQDIRELMAASLHTSAGERYIAAVASKAREPYRHQRGLNTREMGDKNTELVREYMASHLGATNLECARALGMSNVTVGKHVQKLRAEWEDNG